MQRARLERSLVRLPVTVAFFASVAHAQLGKLHFNPLSCECAPLPLNSCR